MTDIVELLKMAARNGNALAGEAADEIENLIGKGRRSLPTESNRPWGVHTIHSITQPGTQCEFMPGAWGPAVAHPYTGNRIVAAWWVLTGRAYAMIWPTSGELNAAIGTPIPKQK